MFVRWRNLGLWAPSRLSQRDLRSVTCHCNITVPASLKSYTHMISASLFPLPFTPAGEMASALTCNACGRNFPSDTGLWKHLRGSQQPGCQAEFQRLLTEQLFPGVSLENPTETRYFLNWILRFHYNELRKFGSQAEHHRVLNEQFPGLGSESPAYTRYFFELNVTI